MFHTDSNAMQNPENNPSNNKLSDIANIMDDILTSMKSHIEHIQKKDGGKNIPVAFKNANTNSYDQSKTLQNIINFTLKDPKYIKNGDKNEDNIFLTDAEKKEILANAFIKVNPYLKPTETNNMQSIRPDLKTLEELIKQTEKDIALSQNLTRTFPPNNPSDKQTAKNIVDIKNSQNNRPDTSQSNRLSRKTTNILKQQKTTSHFDNNLKPIVVRTKVQKPQSPTGGVKSRSSSRPPEKFDVKQPTQPILLKATINKLSIRTSPPPSAKGSTRKPLNNVKNNATSTNLRSRSLSIDNNKTYPQKNSSNRYFNESSKRPSSFVPVSSERATTAVSFARERPATASPLFKPSANMPSKNKPSTAVPNIRPSSKISPTRGRPTSPIHAARSPSGFHSYKERPTSVESRLRPQNQGKSDTKTFPQKIPNNKMTARPKPMDSRSVPKPETLKVIPKKISVDSNNYSLSNASRNTMKKAFSGVKNQEFVKNLTKQISKEILKNNAILTEKRAFYVQGTIPNSFIVNRAFTSVDKNIDQIIKPISANVINQIINKNTPAQTKVINQPVNSAIFPCEAEIKKETNINEIHKLIPTNVKLIENIEKINYHVNKPTEKELENSEQSVTKKSVSFQHAETPVTPGAAMEKQNRSQTPPTPGSRPQTPVSRPQTPTVLYERPKIEKFPMLDLQQTANEVEKLPERQIPTDEQVICTEDIKTCAETIISLTDKEENLEVIDEINKQIEQMIIQVMEPTIENDKGSTPNNLSDGASKLSNLEQVNSMQQKEEPPQSQVIIPFTTKQSTQIIKNAKFLKPFEQDSKSSFHAKLPTSPLSRLSKKFLPAPMDLVQDFINMVTQAKKTKKTYTICGNFFALRRAFAERGWIEKMRITIMDDKESWRKIESLSNYELVEGMRNKENGEKYRRVFLTKLLAGHQVDFYWDYLTNPFTVNNDRVKRTLINRFPYGATRSYTTKHGLSQSLKESHWFSIEGYANILFPRTYNLAIDEELKSFIDDFRITGAISLLQWILNTTSDKVMSAEGTIPISVFNFATMQCHHFLKEREHRDIDELIPMTKECEWDVFLDKYYKLIHFEHMFQKSDKVSIDAMVDQSKYIINKVKKYLPDLNIDGHRNMWLLKPNNGSRGSGILVCRTLKYMLEALNSKKDIKYIVQKYIERPLLIRKTKFDIRQWFLITCMPNVKIWIYKESYLRFSSQVFDLGKLHESIHLTNNSIQCRYKNHNNRSNILPDQNMWHSDTFRRYLADIGHPYTWRNIIYKGMKECLIGLFMLCQDKLETRVNSFELCGADFMLDENFRPYLIEINSRPALYPSTKITGKMCPKVLEDVIKVVIDNARNPKASTGEFELIYTDTFNYSIPRHENSLHMKGVNYFQKYAKQNLTKVETLSSIKIAPSVKITPLIPIQQENSVNSESLQKFLNLDASRVRQDVKKTLEKILGVINSCEENDEANREKAMKRSKQLRSMLSEFVNIISTSAGKNKIDDETNFDHLVQFREDDGLPVNICTNCIEELNQAFLFAKRCETTDTILRECVENFKTELADNLFQPQKIKTENEIQIEITKEIITPNTCQTEVFNDFEYVQIKQEKDVEIECEEYNMEEVLKDYKYVEVKQENNVQIECNAVKQEETIIENESDETYDDPMNESYEEDDRDQNKTYSERSKHQSYTCEVCSKTFAHQHNLKRHMRIHTGEKPFTCGICNTAFTDTTSLKYHMITHTGDKPYTCGICNKAFNQHIDLKKHTRIHTGDKPYPCGVCSKAFNQCNDLKKHERIHTQEKLFTCGVCSKGFTLAHHLKRHMRTHTGERSFNCVVCNKTFTQKCHLKEHIRIHTGNKPYICEICNKAFNQQNDLKIHTRIHTGEKPYSCEVCGKAFTRHYHLKEHTMRLHTKERPHACGVCNKAFNQLADLKRHTLRIHTKEKPYVCEVCGRSYCRNSDLTVHKRIHAKEATKNVTANKI